MQFVLRVGSDLAALAKLTSRDTPPLRMVRGNKSVKMLYGFGDASGHGFGAALQASDG